MSYLSKKELSHVLLLVKKIKQYANSGFYLYFCSGEGLKAGKLKNRKLSSPFTE